MADRDTPTTTLVKPLTSIRFFAASAVVLFHSGASWASTRAEVPGFVKTWLLNGYLGVTFFFVLSGFILHYTYRGRVVGAAKLRSFGVARFARVYPIYLLAVLAMLPFIVPRGLKDVPQFLLLHSWFPAGLVGISNWNMPSWTLSVELFFYLVFPWFSRGAVRLGSRSLIALVVALLLFDFATGSSALIDNRVVMWSWMRWIPVPLFRLPEFVVGICVAELHLRRGDRRFPIPAFLPAFILFVAMGLSNALVMAAFATTMMTLLIVAVAGDRGSLLSRVLGWRWLVLLGSASYSLYLFHQPVHFAVAAIAGESKLALVVQYPLLIAASIVLFLFVEEPAREWIRTRTGLKPSAIEPVAAAVRHDVGGSLDGQAEDELAHKPRGG